MRKILNLLFQPFMNFAIQFGYGNDINENKHNQILRSINRTIKSSDARWLPTSLAYYIMVSVVPLISLVFLTLSIFPGWSEYIQGTITSLLPEGNEEVINGLVQFLTSDVDIITLIIIAFYSIWYSSKATIAVNDMATYLYGVARDKDRPMWRKYGRSLFSLGIIISFAGGLAFGVVFLPQFLKSEWFREFISIPGFLVTLIHFGATMFILYFIILLFYTVIPSKKLKLSQARPGALFFSLTLALFLATLSAMLSVGLFDYSNIFGSVAIVIVFGMMALALSYIFFVGMVINVSIEQATKLSSSEEKASFKHRIQRTVKLFSEQYKGSTLHKKLSKRATVENDDVYSIRLGKKKEEE